MSLKGTAHDHNQHWLYYGTSPREATSTHVKWTSGFIRLADRDYYTTGGTNGARNIPMPAVGTVIPVVNPPSSAAVQATVTVTADGVPLAAWQTLYAITRPAQAQAAAVGWIIAPHTSAFAPGEHMIAVATRGVNNGTEVYWDIDKQYMPGPSVSAVQVTCIPTAIGLTPLTTQPPSSGSHYPAGNVGYEFTGAADITVFGLQAKPNGTCCHWRNSSNGNDINFVHLSGGATAATQRIALPEADTPGDGFTLKAGSHMTMQYRTAGAGITPGNVWVVVALTEGE